MQRSVYVSLPCYTGRICNETVEALLQFQRECNQNLWNVYFDLTPRASIIAARNATLERFVESKYDDLVFIDDDVTWQQGGLTRLLSHCVNPKVRIVAGVYPYRADPIDFPVVWRDGPTGMDRDIETGLIEVRRAAAGMLHLTRDAVLQIREAYKDREYIDDNSPTKRAYYLFEYRVLDRYLQTEDFGFMDRWTALGEKVWIDPDIWCAHIGLKQYEGCLAHSMALSKQIKETVRQRYGNGLGSGSVGGTGRPTLGARNGTKVASS